MEEIGGISFIDELIPDSMINKDKEPEYEGTLFWTPIDSTVNNREIQELENYYGHKLLVSYISFLQHRHFIDLQLGADSIRFFKNLPGQLVQDMKQQAVCYYQSLIKRNYLPFAGLSDYGVLCFDSNQLKSNREYPVVSFYHEDEYKQPDHYSTNFESMFVEFEENLDDLIKKRREV
jgi:hypothetical protein